MSLLLYRLFSALYYTGIRALSLWNVKAKLWIEGRKNFPDIDYSTSNYAVVWMHCASLGEFEQGRPLLEEIKLYYADCKIVVSFFSASGYQIVKNYKGADHVFYLPKDSPLNAQKLIQQLNPALVLWVKYEYWFYYLNELKKNNIPTLLISGIYRHNMPFFKWYGALWKKMLLCFTHFFVQNQPSKTILEEIVPADKISNSGDTRFDRVITIAQKFQPVPGIEDFCAAHPVIVAGSTWEEDEAEWVHYVKTHPEIKFIIAPHEIDKENLADVKKEFPGAVFYSEWMVYNQPPTINPLPEIDTAKYREKSKIHCLIIDNIGILSRLYKYATIGYVGGGFGSNGLHNILEAAVYGKPVIFGPEFGKNFEAIEMMEHGGAVTIHKAIELERVLNQLLGDKADLKRKGEAAKNYVYTKAGATAKIMEFVKKNAFLPVDQTVLQKDQNPSSQS